MELRDYLQLPEKGLAVSEAYWREAGLPAVEAAFPAYKNRIAYGLVGEGSECWGFDDIISTDHDYGPSFCMWLTHEDYEEIGEELQALYDSLPAEFHGYTARTHRPMAGKRVGVWDMNQFYARFLGSPAGPQSLTDWLVLPDDYLSAATNGKVFSDPLGRFSRIRNRLLRHYPEDVLRKKLAAQVLKMAQAGQANYPRMMRRGDAVAANEAVTRFISAAISAVYLLNHVYAPYYKWRFRGMTELPLLPEVSGMLEKLASAESTMDAWTKDIILDFTALNMDDSRAALMEEICAMVHDELRRQGLCRSEESFLEPAAFEIYEGIKDPELRSMHILQG